MTRTPLRAHIHAVFVTSRSGNTVPPRSALAGTSTSEGRRQGAEQNPQVEPQRPVADVIRVARCLAGHVGHRALAHLPHPAETRTDLVAERAELRAEFRQVVVGKRPWTDEAHVALGGVPELGVLRDAEPTQPSSVAGNLALCC